MLLPDNLKTSQLAGDSGYDTYLRDAHKQVSSPFVINALSQHYSR